MICKCAVCGHEWKSRWEQKPKHCSNPKCQALRWENGIKQKTGRKANSLEKFLTLFEKSDGCWIFKGFINSFGYGMFKYNGKYWQAHRLSYVIHNGLIPMGKIVCHKCDNPKCVNPDHLFLGTTQDNVADRVAKNRSAIAEKNWNTKLTREDVLKIRNADFSEKGSKKRMADELGISQTALHYIEIGKNWSHV